MIIRKFANGNNISMEIPNTLNKSTRRDYSILIDLEKSTIHYRTEDLIYVYCETNNLTYMESMNAIESGGNSRAKAVSDIIRYAKKHG